MLSVSTRAGLEKVPSAGSGGIERLPHCPSNWIEAEAGAAETARKADAAMHASSARRRCRTHPRTAAVEQPLTVGPGRNLTPSTGNLPVARPIIPPSQRDGCETAPLATRTYRAGRLTVNPNPLVRMRSSAGVIRPEPRRAPRARRGDGREARSSAAGTLLRRRASHPCSGRGHSRAIQHRPNRRRGR